MAVNNVRLGLYGALTGSLLALGGCHAKYDASAELIRADSFYGNNDGVLSKLEAMRYITTHYLKTSRSYSGLSLEEAKSARQLGKDAKKSAPEHAKVFLETLSQIENIYGINAEESSK